MGHRRRRSGLFCGCSSNCFNCEHWWLALCNSRLCDACLACKLGSGLDRASINKSQTQSESPSFAQLLERFWRGLVKSLCFLMLCWRFFPFSLVCGNLAFCSIIRQTKVFALERFNFNCDTDCCSLLHCRQPYLRQYGWQVGKKELHCFKHFSRGCAHSCLRVCAQRSALRSVTFHRMLVLWGWNSIGIQPFS